LKNTTQARQGTANNLISLVYHIFLPITYRCC